MVYANKDNFVIAQAEVCMTIEQIAKASGVSKSMVHRMSKGYLVRPDKLGKVAKVLGVSARDLIQTDEEVKKQ